MKQKRQNSIYINIECEWSNRMKVEKKNHIVSVDEV